jgi:hypothetical protein
MARGRAFRGSNIPTANAFVQENAVLSMFGEAIGTPGTGRASTFRSYSPEGPSTGRAIPPIRRQSPFSSVHT